MALPACSGSAIPETRDSGGAIRRVSVTVGNAHLVAAGSVYRETPTDARSDDVREYDEHRVMPYVHLINHRVCRVSL